MQARTLALVALAGLVTACASGTFGRPIPREHVRAIQRGVTTTAQVQEMFGDPDSRKVAADGTETWAYSYEANNDSRIVRGTCGALVFIRYLILPLYGFCEPSRTEQQLRLDFNPQLVVASYSFASRQVSLDDRGRGRRRDRVLEPIVTPVLNTGDTRLASDAH